MNDNIKNDLQIEFANAAGMLASRLSLNPTVGQIYGLLYMSPIPVSLNDMVEKLGISKGSASTNVRILESWGAVKKVWVNNSRKDYYEANPDTLEIIMNRLKEGLKKRLTEAKQNLGTLEAKFDNLKDEKDKDEEFYIRRIEAVRKMYKQGLEFLEFLSQ